MTTPTITATPAKPDAAKAAAAMWRSLCALAPRIDPRLNADLAASDPVSVANLSHLYGGDPADTEVIRAYVIEEKLTP